MFTLFFVRCCLLVHLAIFLALILVLHCGPFMCPSVHPSVQLWTDASNVVASLVIILVVWLHICVVKSKSSYHCCHHPFGLWNEPSSTKLYYQREQTVAQASAEASKGLVTAVTDLRKRVEVVSE